MMFFYLYDKGQLNSNLPNYNGIRFASFLVGMPGAGTFLIYTSRLGFTRGAETRSGSVPLAFPRDGVFHVRLGLRQHQAPIRIQRAVLEGGYRAAVVATFLGCHPSKVSRALQKEVVPR